MSIVASVGRLSQAGICRPGEPTLGIACCPPPSVDGGSVVDTFERGGGASSVRPSPHGIDGNPHADLLDRCREILIEAARGIEDGVEPSESRYRPGFERAAGKPLPVYFSPDMATLTTLPVPAEDLERVAAVERAAQQGKQLVYVQVVGTLVPERELGYQGTTNYRGWSQNPTVTWQFPVVRDPEASPDSLTEALENALTVPVTAEEMRAVAKELPTARLIFEGNGHAGLDGKGQRRTVGGPNAPGEHWQRIQLDFRGTEEGDAPGVIVNQWFVRVRERGFIQRAYEGQSHARHAYELTTHTTVDLSQPESFADAERILLGEVDELDTAITERRKVGRRYEIELDLDRDVIPGPAKLELGMRIGQAAKHFTDDDVKQDRQTALVYEAVLTQPGLSTRILETSIMVPLKAFAGYGVPLGPVSAYLSGGPSLDEKFKVSVRFPLVTEVADEGLKEKIQELFNDARKSLVAMLKGGWAALRDPAAFRIHPDQPNPTGTELVIERLAQRTWFAGAGVGFDINMPLKFEADLGVGYRQTLPMGQIRRKKVAIKWVSNAGESDSSATGQQLEVRTEAEQLNPRAGGRFYFDLDPDRHDDGGGVAVGVRNRLLQLVSKVLGTGVEIGRSGKGEVSDERTIRGLDSSDPVVRKALSDVVRDSNPLRVDPVEQTARELDELQRHGKALFVSTEGGEESKRNWSWGVAGFEVERVRKGNTEVGTLDVEEGDLEFGRVWTKQTKSANHDVIFGKRPVFENETTKIYLDRVVPRGADAGVKSHFLLRVKSNVDDPSTSIEELAALKALLEALHAKTVIEIKEPRTGFDRWGFSSRGDHGYSRRSATLTFDLAALGRTLDVERERLAASYAAANPTAMPSEVDEAARRGLRRLGIDAYLASVRSSDPDALPPASPQARAFLQWYAAAGDAVKTGRIETDGLARAELLDDARVVRLLEGVDGGRIDPRQARALCRRLRVLYEDRFENDRGRSFDLDESLHHWRQAQQLGDLAERLAFAALHPGGVQEVGKRWEGFVEALSAGGAGTDDPDAFRMWRTLTALALLSAEAVPHYDVLVQGDDAYMRAAKGDRPPLSTDLQEHAKRRAN